MRLTASDLLNGLAGATALTGAFMVAAGCYFAQEKPMPAAAIVLAGVCCVAAGKSIRQEAQHQRLTHTA